MVIYEYIDGKFYGTQVVDKVGIRSETTLTNIHDIFRKEVILLKCDESLVTSRYTEPTVWSTELLYRELNELNVYINNLKRR